MAHIYNYIHSAVYRIKDIIQGTGVYKHLDILRREQYLPLENLRSLQEDRLLRLLIRAANHSPYYRDILGKLPLSSDPEFKLDRLEEIPLLTRELLQSNLVKILCDDARDPVPNSSGGSTGNPVNFYQDNHYIQYSRAANLLFMDWMGVNSGDKTAVFWGADRDFKERSLREKAWGYFDRITALNSFSMSEDSIESFLLNMNEFNPRYIQGYAGSLYLIAKYINQKYPIAFRPHAIRSSAEMLYDFQRDEIERAFRTKVFNFYGSREVNNLAAECAAHEGLHMFSSGRIIEIVDSSGRTVPDGTLGHIAVTDLTNMTFPFIRYLNGDMAIKSEKPCSCGRSYPLLEKVVGRTTDMIRVNNQYIHGEYFTHLFYQKPGIRQFQVIQERDGNLKVLVVRDNESANIDDIVAKIKEKIGSEIKISVEYTDHIPTTGTGKYRFTVSLLGNTGN